MGAGRFMQFLAAFVLLVVAGKAFVIDSYVADDKEVRFKKRSNCGTLIKDKHNNLMKIILMKKSKNLI